MRQWLREHCIPVRRSGTGLDHRGVTPPTADELRSLIHEQFLGYAGVAARYGVDPSAVRHWLIKHNIPRPRIWETRRKGNQPKMPSRRTLRTLYGQGMSIERIAERYGVCESTMAARCREAGIKIRNAGWSHHELWRCQDGPRLRSSLEVRVDAWLHRHGIAHEVSPRLPIGSNSAADFKVGQFYIEIWGVQNRDDYTMRKHVKRAMYDALGLPLIEIAAGDFSAQANSRWERKLAYFLLGDDRAAPRVLPAWRKVRAMGHQGDENRDPRGH